MYYYLVSLVYITCVKSCVDLVKDTVHHHSALGYIGKCVYLANHACTKCFEGGVIFMING